MSSLGVPNTFPTKSQALNEARTPGQVCSGRSLPGAILLAALLGAGLHLTSCEVEPPASWASDSASQEVGGQRGRNLLQDSLLLVAVLALYCKWRNVVFCTLMPPLVHLPKEQDQLQWGLGLGGTVVDGGSWVGPRHLPGSKPSWGAGNTREGWPPFPLALKHSGGTGNLLEHIPES